MKNRILLLALMASLHFNMLNAQCSIEQNTATHSISVNATEEIGQSFIACNSSYIEQIKVNIANLSMASINLKLTLAQGNNTMTNILNTQMVTVNSAGMLFIPIDEKIYLTKGEAYTFSLVGVGSSGTLDYNQTLGNLYTEGQMLRNNTAFTNFDLLFGVFMATDPTGLAIPTMSQWGLLIFSLLILNISVFYLPFFISDYELISKKM